MNYWFLNGQKLEKFTQKYVNWQTFANARCHCRFRSIRICKMKLQKRNKVGKFIDLQFESLLCALTDILTHLHRITWCPFELSLVRFMIRLCWYSTGLKRTCVQFVCLLNMRESFESHLSYSGNVINSRVLKSKLAVNKTSLHCLTQMFLLFPLELIKENINFLHNTDNTQCHHHCHFLPT